MAKKSLSDKIEAMKRELEELELQAANQANGKSIYPFEVGKSYFIRTVTYHLLGKVKAIKGGFLVLKDASWVADSGRFNETINKGVWGTSAEREPVVVDTIVNLSAITDAFEWIHALPKEVK